MRLKKTLKVKKPVVTTNEKKETSKKQKQEVIERYLYNEDIEVSDTVAIKVTAYQYGEDEEDIDTRLDIRTWIDTEKYTGATKKGINVPLENIYKLRGMLDDIIKIIEEK